ncbi:hypothetical protein [Spirillospora sp. NPDC029432]|uniref:hypothetical protein n=1 Tax=Spirillospora sp. NPDC029432 TaxID=3154599 RepID=UPI003454323A
MDVEHEWQLGPVGAVAVARGVRPGRTTCRQSIVAPESGFPRSARAALDARKRFSASR